MIYLDDFAKVSLVLQQLFPYWIWCTFWIYLDGFSYCCYKKQIRKIPFFVYFLIVDMGLEGKKMKENLLEKGRECEVYMEETN